jgi:hypothetical protein
MASGMKLSTAIAHTSDDTAAKATGLVLLQQRKRATADTTFTPQLACPHNIEQAGCSVTVNNSKAAY